MIDQLLLQNYIDSDFIIIYILFIAFFVNFIGTEYFVAILRRIRIAKNRRLKLINKKRPNSSEIGGTIVVLTTILAFLCFALTKDELFFISEMPIILSYISLFFVLTTYKYGYINIIVNLLLQVVITTILVLTINGDGNLLMGYVEPIIDQVISVIILLIFSNLYGITLQKDDAVITSRTIHITSSIFLFSFFINFDKNITYYALIILSIMLGFLPWNWYKAKVISSINSNNTIGFILGVLLLKIALSGYHIVAILLPIYYIADNLLSIIAKFITTRFSGSYKYFVVIRRKDLPYMIMNVAFVNFLITIIIILWAKHLLFFSEALMMSIILSLFSTLFLKIKWKQ